MKDNQKVFHHLLFMVRPFEVQLSELLRHHDIHRSEWSVLYAMVHYPEITSVELAQILSVEKPNITRTIKDLSNRGYIIIQPSTIDKRRKVLQLTMAGIKKYQELRLAIDRFEQEILNEISPQEQTELIEIVDKIKNNLNQRVGFK